MPSNKDLPLLYEDNHYVAINKPSGLLVHRTGIDASETRFAMQMLRDQLGRRVYPAHRIDKPTSGVLLFALDSEALVEIKKGFEENRISKEYQAIVRGHAPRSGEIDRPLRQLLDFGPKAKSEKEQSALTRYQLISKTETPYPSGPYQTTRYSYVSCEPQTGRRHQLRRHMAHIDCPIIGDTKRNAAFREQYGFVRLFLHAARIAFTHPITREQIAINAPHWPDFNQALEATGLTPR